MFSGTMIGIACVLALLAAAIVLVVLDRKERSPILGRMILITLIAAFVGGVSLALIGGIQPRIEHAPMVAASPPPMSLAGTIGTVDTTELQQLEAAVQSDPSNVVARERLGHLYLQQQDFEKVFLMAHEALKLNPKSVESRVHMGVVLFASQDIPGALAQLDKALALDPKNAEALRFKQMIASRHSEAAGNRRP